MRAFLSKFLLTIFIAIFAVPSSLLASPGNNWTPPPGGPVMGTNVPAPVNIGPDFQKKQGPLTIGSDFTSQQGTSLNGYTFFNNANMGTDFGVSFIPFNFFNTVNVGDSTTPTDFNLSGKFKFTPPSGVGVPPQPGYVLKARDAQGNVVWGPGSNLPTGTNAGDTLIWDPTCNCWVTGPGGGTGNLPPGEAGQTIWFDGTTNTWQATSKVFHDTTSLNNTRTTIDSEVTNIKGPVGVFVGQVGSGETDILSPTTKINGTTLVQIGSGSSPTSTTKMWSRFIDVGSASLSQPQDLNVYSSTVNFKDPAVNGLPQNVTFNSSSIKFKGPVSDPEALDAGWGRIPFSTDNEGTFKWNKNLTYLLYQPIPGITLGQLGLTNPEGGIAAFMNQGITVLGGDTTITDNGDLYLEGLEGGSINQAALGEIKHLCFIEGNKKVVRCPTATDPNATLGGGLTPTPSTSGGDGTVIYTVEDNGYGHTFDFTGTVTVKYCGGGGGGGGGGVGQPAADVSEMGQGANGGGGGAAGECRTESLDVVSGDTLLWDIGQGGDGGDQANYSGSPTPAYNGSSGETTRLDFDPVDAGVSQLGSLASGGLGGQPGRSVFQGLLQNAASHGNFTLANSSDDWYFNGGGGRNNVGVSNHDQPGNPVPADPGCAGCGGPGGIGEVRSIATGALSGPSNPVLEGQSSYRGGGGVQPQSGEQNSTLHGKNGRCGSIGNGGGGGGGSAGKLAFVFTQASLHGGQGGCGGGGYVMISGLPTSTAGSGELTYNTPGTFSLTTFQENNVIPAGVNTFTVEIWGAGGGAGGVLTSSSAVRRSGAGGSGGYRTMQLGRDQLFNANFEVGARGSNGAAVDTGVAPNGAGGSPSRISPISTGPNGFTALGANGGSGGQGYTSGGATGGLGGGPLPSGYPSGVTTGATGVSGNTNSGPCNLAGETISPNNGYGAGSPRMCTDGTLNVFQGSAQDGRIRISW